MICEICKDNVPITDTHHIHSTSLGGSNHIWNKCNICPNCHRKVHVGEIIIEGKFSTSNGNIVVWRDKNTPSITGVTDPEVFLYKRVGY